MSTPPAPTFGRLDLRPGQPPILWVDPVADAPGWAMHHRNDLRQVVARHGALLARGLGLRDHGQTAAVFQRLAANGLMIEREAFAPRQDLGGGLYSSTPWPATQQMCHHHELSYALDVPGFMLFACLAPPSSGGTTPLADAGAVLQALPPGLVQRFEHEGWLLVRNYNADIGASWAEAFGTEDRAAVEHYCLSQAIEFAWQADGGLHTRQRRRAVVRHPVDGRPCWFNQVAFLNEWTLDPDIREYLVESYGSEGLPFTTRFGNGEPIGEDVVNIINETYAAHSVREPWQPGDLMVIDNIRTAHGREPYEGHREVVAGMADAVRLGAAMPAGPGTR